MDKTKQNNVSQQTEPLIDQIQIQRLKQIQQERMQRQKQMIAFLLPINDALITQNILAPLEFIKTRFQLMNEMIRNKTLQTKYTSYFNCLKTTFKQEKRGFYKGNFAYSMFIFGQMTLTALTVQKAKIEINQVIKKNYFDQYQIFKYGNPLPYLFYGFGGLMMHPLEYARIRLMTDKQSSLIRDGKKQFKGIFNTIISTTNGDGIRGIFRGAWTSYFNRVLHRSLFFGLNQIILSHLKQVDAKTKLFVSSLSCFAADLLTYPIDTIRKRMMMRSLQNQKYNSSFGCIRYITKNENLFKGFYGGVGITIFRSIVGGALILAADDNAKSMLQAQIQRSELTQSTNLVSFLDLDSNKKRSQSQKNLVPQKANSQNKKI